MESIQATVWRRRRSRVGLFFFFLNYLFHFTMHSFRDIMHDEAGSRSIMNFVRAACCTMLQLLHVYIMAPYSRL